jgi:hypothetical protein
MADRAASSSAASEDASGRAAAARHAPAEAILGFIRTAGEDVLAAALDNPNFDKDHAALLPILLDRKDLPEAILERVSKRTRWMTDAAVRRKLAAHTHTARRVATRLLREFHLPDLVQFSLQPSTPAEARRLADELIVARIGQLPLGQKKTLARRGSASVAGALLADSSAAVVAAALGNAFLNEAQLLKALSRRTLDGETVSAIGHHSRWTHYAAVRAAVITHPHAPADLVLEFLPALSRRDLEDLAALAHVSASAKQYFQHELARRLRLAKHGDAG